MCLWNCVHQESQWFPLEMILRLRELSRYLHRNVINVPSRCLCHLLKKETNKQKTTFYFMKTYIFTFSDLIFVWVSLQHRALVLYMVLFACLFLWKNVKGCNLWTTCWMDLTKCIRLHRQSEQGGSPFLKVLKSKTQCMKTSSLKWLSVFEYL